MFHVDIPSPEAYRRLAAVRADACVSIYVETTPLTQQADASRIAFQNLARDAMAQLEAAGFDKRRALALAEHFDDIAEDDDFWAVQARSLAVLATPDSVRTFRLANRLTPTAQVSDRFHLKPLLRAITFPHAGFVLALSENDARLVAFSADGAPQEARVPDMPKDAASAVGKSSINDRSHSRRIAGSEGQKVRLRQYARAVEAALRPVLRGETAPLILACNPPLEQIFRSVCSYPHLLADGFHEATDRSTPAELAAAARPILDASYAAEVADLRAHFAARLDQRRATTDVSLAARAAAAGAVEALLVDMDNAVPGLIDEATGEVLIAEAEGADTYGVIDQIATLALNTGARVLAVRQEDIPEGAPLAAVLRYAM